MSPEDKITTVIGPEGLAEKYDLSGAITNDYTKTTSLIDLPS